MVSISQLETSKPPSSVIHVRDPACRTSQFNVKSFASRLDTLLHLFTDRGACGRERKPAPPPQPSPLPAQHPHRDDPGPGLSQEPGARNQESGRRGVASSPRTRILSLYLSLIRTYTFLRVSFFRVKRAYSISTPRTPRHVTLFSQRCGFSKFVASLV